MKLKEGMYVRTNYRKEKVIRKIVKIVEDDLIHDHYLIFDKPTKYTYYVEDNNFISKENVIELIEIGDYVNGYRVYSGGENHFDYILTWDEESDYYMKIELPSVDIKDIVTKEQFNSVKYEVE